MEMEQLTWSFLHDFQSGWNQFEANEKLFGVVSSFDENIYTTKLDKTKLSTAQSREAERLAQEIERQTSGNFHLQEERGQRVQDDGLDEEARYSSVDRTKGSPAASGVGLQSLRWLHLYQLTLCADICADKDPGERTHTSRLGCATPSDRQVVAPSQRATQTPSPRRRHLLPPPPRHPPKRRRV
jgi:hypothetical protein